MKASRLVSTMLLLQVRGRMTAAELAEELEVSVRTVYRDIEALSMAGVPVWSEAGTSGGFQLVDGYRTRLNGLSRAEAEALLLAGASGPMAELGLGTVLAAAQAKLLAALPDDVAKQAFLAGQRFHIDTSGWFRAARVPAQLAGVAEALWADRRLRMAYRASGSADAIERLVDPLGLVLKAGVWYLVARRDDRLRTYRVSRIESATPTEEPFERPRGFDLAGYWRHSVADYEQSAPSLAVTVSATARAAGVLTGAEPAGDPSGRRELTLQFDDVPTACEELLRFGPDVEVLGPREVRTRLARLAAETAARYGARRRGGGRQQAT